MSSYQAPITIKEALKNISSKKYLLPAIQREFVWSQNQIEVLFDSLMRNYPIGTFLLWSVENVDKFQFYEFIRNYHELEQSHNIQVIDKNNNEITAILDGQQRLSALYIGLMGSYSAKLPYYHSSSSHAFPKKQLYLNLYNRLDDESDIEYEFKFLTEKEAENSYDCCWFPCNKIIEFNDSSEPAIYLMDNDLLSNNEKNKFAMKTLNSFYNIVHQKEIISAYIETDQKLDTVLQIFIRTNSGGIKLSYSDLLLSVATAQWSKNNAREEIYNFVDKLNQIASDKNPIPFNFNKDLILKSCLVLSDLDVKFKVDNFTVKNMEIIEENWKDIRNALTFAVILIANFGFNGNSLTTYNAIIPIAYYIHYNKLEKNILDSTKYYKDRQKIKEWLTRSILKNVFGGQPDSIYPALRKIIKESSSGFPLTEIIEHYRGRQRSIIFGDDELDALLELKYKDKKTYSLLMLLQPSLNQYLIYDKDHLHPRSKFTDTNYKLLGLTNDDIIFYESYKDRIANIQLLPKIPNVEKSNQTLEEWVRKNNIDENSTRHFLKENFLSENISLDFKDFREFITNREDNLKKALKIILKTKSNT